MKNHYQPPTHCDDCCHEELSISYSTSLEAINFCLHCLYIVPVANKVADEEMDIFWMRVVDIYAKVVSTYGLLTTPSIHLSHPSIHKASLII